MVIGYTTGVFDLFHVGHVNMLKNARAMCDRLIVGVSTDELVGYKNKKAVISHVERMRVVESCRYVDVVVPQGSMDKFAQWKKIKFDVMFVGDDWYKTDKWKIIDEQFEKVGVKVVYLPYTVSTSSTLINETLENLRAD